MPLPDELLHAQIGGATLILAHVDLSDQDAIDAILIEAASIANPGAAAALITLRGGHLEAEGVRGRMRALYGDAFSSYDWDVKQPAGITDILEGAALVLCCGSPASAWVPLLSMVLSRQRRPGVWMMLNEVAAACGEWIIPPDANAIRAGLHWLPGAAVMVVPVSPAERTDALELLEREPHAYIIQLHEGASLVLRSGDEPKVLGDVNPGILLGKGWIDHGRR